MPWVFILTTVGCDPRAPAAARRCGGADPPGRNHRGPLCHAYLQTGYDEAVTAIERDPCQPPLSGNASAGLNSFALAYFLSYLFRVVNAVIAPNLAADSSRRPGRFRAVDVRIFVSFAAFQLPWGCCWTGSGRGASRRDCWCSRRRGRSLSRSPPAFGVVHRRQRADRAGVSSGYMPPSSLHPLVSGASMAADQRAASGGRRVRGAFQPPCRWNLPWGTPIGAGCSILLSIVSALVDRFHILGVPEKRQMGSAVRLSDQLKASVRSLLLITVLARDRR